MTYSAEGRRAVMATSGDEPLELAEITHADLEVPIRVVNDTIDIIVDGNTFIACPFTLSRPDDVDQQTPTAKISVDNIGRELTQFLEQSKGGKGARIRIMAVLRSQPDVKEFDIAMDLSGISINNMTVDGNLGFQNTLMQPAVAMRFDPLTSPGCY